ncbi:hypothetical protein K525DRAFT_261282 [Schizophyllum commune Loenen D]|nr:hypothetical protein K525DRAFT_261282 [Schizophyllum commune Loenen D]
MNARLAFAKLARAAPAARRQTRAFHSPFTILNTAIPPSTTKGAPRDNSPLTSPPPPEANLSSADAFTGDQYAAYSTENRPGDVYVVCDPTVESFHNVPTGAYPTSHPYVNWKSAPAPATPDVENLSSTSADPFAHPITKNVDRNPSGVMESAALRHREAPGEMDARGGSYSGEGLADAQGTTKGSGLADRNPPPLSKEAEKWSKAGVKDAWKQRL